MADTAPRPTAHDVRAALKLRYPPAEFALLWEVANGTGASARRYADAVAFGLWPSHGNKLEGIEVKVSRADFLQEMKQPAKSAAIYRYCHHWWLACPKDMVKPDELPPTWGLLELQPDGTMRARRKAPLLTPEDMPREFVASLLRRHAGNDEDMAAVRIRAEVEREVRRTREELERQYQQRQATRMKIVEEGVARLEAVKAATGLDFTHFSMHSDGGLLRAVKLVHALGEGGTYGALGAIRRGAREVLKVLDDAAIDAADERQ